MHKKHDAIIVGGGLFGVSTAYFLAKAGWSVLLIDRGFIGAASSGANFGGLRLQGRALEQYPLSLLAQQYWERFQEEFGSPCEYERNGMIYFAHSDKGREKLLHYAENSRQCGLAINLWEGEELRKNLPWLSGDGIIASYSPACAVANPRLATPAIARAFKRLGGSILENCVIEQFRKDGDGFVLTSADGQEFMAATLINAAGGWADSIAETFGETVPLLRAGPPQFVTEPLPYVLKPSIYTIEGDLIIRQISRGNFIFAGYPRTMSNEDGRHTFVPPAKTRNGMQAIGRYIPALKHAEVIRVWSGVEAYLPDMLPVIGASQTTPGLFHAFGGSGGGFQVGPAVGLCLSNIILGRPNDVPMEPYGIGRFRSQIKTSDKLKLEFDAARPTQRRHL
ncbi:FAD-dependent oxidoreductase [Falsochrobactrum shanghaiense]|uniref:FAD-dependent oxidoreductase n=1 Tax=Falsochrobactrum shanghaiense TaxID=2201899 RepID=A0A316JAX4_9HYPH|nr:FAD-binding oxidoreductase [Falsochrobactrum shanghaiense]PWL18391.1 FAD-dependent oxidoreductase [Falsochrobactrum shanghaiense]